MNMGNKKYKEKFCPKHNQHFGDHLNDCPICRGEALGQEKPEKIILKKEESKMSDQEKIVGTKGFDLEAMKEIAGQLNQMEILSKPIDIEKSAEELVENFIDGIEGLNAEGESKIPKAAVAVYNNFVDILDEGKKEVDSFKMLGLAQKKKDVGKKDAGKKDAGKKDVGKKDAGKKDAGKKDAGKKDAGKKDAGKKDAGKKDAGKKDAGKKDAGKKDAGKKDAGKKTKLKPYAKQPRIGSRADSLYQEMLKEKTLDECLRNKKLVEIFEGHHSWIRDNHERLLPLVESTGK